MKNLLLIIVLISSLTIVSCSDAPSEKSKSSTEEFAALSDEDGFSENHDEPEGIKVDLTGEMREIPVENGEPTSVYFLPNAESNKYLFVIHEWWGLNDHIKMEADHLFDNLGNVNVMALDLYDGQLAEKREEAQKLMSGVDEERIENIINAAINSLPENAEVGTIGWCFGGGWSLRAALMAGDKTRACVMYYGMPVKDVERLKELNSNVMFIYGKQDQWINEEVANEFKMNMEKAEKDIQVLAFDADHAFANPSSEHYKEAAAQEANENARGYLRARLID